MTVNYRNRTILAGLCSITLHVLIMFRMGAGCWSTPVSLASRREPIVLELEQPEPDNVRDLIETRVAAAKPLDKTDFISDKKSEAQDPHDEHSHKTAPRVEKVGDFVDPGETGQPDVKPDRREPVERLEKKTEDTSERVRVAKAIAAADRVPPEPRATCDTPDKTPDAEARRPPQPSRGRVEGGINGKGFLAFDAMQDEIAPYLLEIRRKVEREWWSALALYYSGTSPTKAVIDCAINPDGELVHARVVDPGGSPSFAPLCRVSLQRAAPFRPFPFSVPDIFRSKKLEITWTFHFLE